MSDPDHPGRCGHHGTALELREVDGPHPHIQYACRDCFPELFHKPAFGGPDMPGEADLEQALIDAALELRADRVVLWLARNLPVTLVCAIAEAVDEALPGAVMGPDAGQPGIPIYGPPGWSRRV